MENTVKSLQTVEIETNNGLKHAIMIAIDVVDLVRIDVFVQHVIHQFQLQRMTSPPDTSMMLITVIGNITAEEFKKYWVQYIKSDPIMTVFMSQMEKADVIHGTEQGGILDTVSLLES